MMTRTIQQVLMKVTHRTDGREAYLLFALPDPPGVPGHPKQCHCALINAFATDARIIAKIPLGQALVLEGPGDFRELAADRLRDMLGTDWQVEMFAQRPR